MNMIVNTSQHLVECARDVIRLWEYYIIDGIKCWLPLASTHHHDRWAHFPYYGPLHDGLESLNSPAHALWIQTYCRATAQPTSYPTPNPALCDFTALPICS